MITMVTQLNWEPLGTRMKLKNTLLVLLLPPVTTALLLMDTMPGADHFQGRLLLTDFFNLGVLVFCVF